MTELLQSKLYVPPVRPGLVARPRLIRRLDEGLHRKLTLVSAQAGSGKTTLVADWLQGARPPSSWLSLDHGDNDLVRFFSYLIAALQKIDKGIGRDAQDFLEAPQPPPAETMVAALINDTIRLLTPVADSGSRFVLVLDDYHAITELSIHAAMAFLLERQPPQMHLVLITRQDPPLPLPTLRARGQVTEIREADLRFSSEEARTFLNQSLNLDLDTPEIAVLEERTEGWAAGLQLAALAMQGSSAGQELDRDAATRFIEGFSGQHQFILDYLTDEVLRRQPEFIRSFLLQTSILERLCGPLCDAVLGADQELEGRLRQTSAQVISHASPSQEILESLERANLFLVPLDGERRWYRYHRLFSDLLRALLREMWPDRIPELHRRAALWFEGQDLASEATHHALSTRDLDMAADLIERVIQKATTWSRVSGATLLKWLEALPDGITRTRPRLRLFAARALYATGQWEATDRALRSLETWLDENPGAPGSGAVLQSLASDRASYAAVLGNVGEAVEYAQKALARLAPDDSAGRIRAMSLMGLASVRAGEVLEASRVFSEIMATTVASGWGFAAVPLVCNLIDIQIAQGQLQKARQTCEQAVALGTIDGSLTPATGFAGVHLGRILYEQNELAEAERQTAQGLDLLRQGGISAVFGNGHALLGLIRLARGDEAGALAAMQHAVQLAHSSAIPRLAVQASAYQAHMWLARGDIRRAAAWAEEYRQIGPTEYLRDLEDLTLVRVLLVTGQSQEAFELLQTLLSPADVAGRIGAVIEILVLRAQALRALDSTPDRALASLEQALLLAEPEGYVRLFVDAGEPMEGLLRQMAALGAGGTYARQLLEIMAEERRAGVSTTGPYPSLPTGPSPLIEPISRREKEVLQLLAAGLTNREIARKLVITLPTVKSHTRNLYGKLAVHSRQEAVVVARALGLLPPDPD